MGWIEVDCRNPDCPASFKVDEQLDERQCHRCGTVNRAPWSSSGGDAGPDGHAPGGTRRTVRVPRDLDRAVAAAVERGRFGSYSAAVRAGLRAVADEERRRSR